MGDSPNFKRSDLIENLYGGLQDIARAHIESHCAPPEALEVARCRVHLGPVALVFGCRPGELRELYRALWAIIDQGAVALVPTAGSVARIAVSLAPVEGITRSERIPAGPLAGFPGGPPLECEPREFGVRIRGEDAAEAERRLAWLVGQAGCRMPRRKGIGMMFDSSTRTKSALREEIRLALECIEIDGRPLRESASPEVLELIRTETHIGPFLLIHVGGRAEQERLSRGLRSLDAWLDSSTVSAGAVAALIVRLDPIEILLDGGQLGRGAIRELYRAGCLRTAYTSPIGVEVRGVSSAESERRIAWLLEQGLQFGGIAA